ncbi:MAG: TIGR02452 family protein [Bacteroidota bacterium]
MKRSNRREIARDSLKIIEAGQYQLNDGRIVSIRSAQEAAEAATIVYTSEELEGMRKTLPSFNFSTEYRVVADTTFDATRQLIQEGRDNPYALNFASAKNPGGGFLNGSQAQEESLARASGLYPCLLTAQHAYYELHRNTRSCMYTDTMIYAPLVPIFKDEKGNLLPELLTASILTSPAVNAGVVRRKEPDRVGEIVDVMRIRIEKVLSVAAHHGHRTLILGAWGCGVFRNDPEEIAELFQEALQGPFAGMFELVVFAVYARDERFISPFRRLFGS